MQKENPYDYNQLRAAIHNILYSYDIREIECAQDDEFDYEFMECCTDEIIRLIKRQGGQI